VILYKGTVVEFGSTARIYSHPLHPYTQMLMASVPHLDKKWGKKAVELAGKSDGSQAGCAYYPRCPLPEKGEQCLAAVPRLVEVEPDHLVACCCRK